MTTQVASSIDPFLTSPHQQNDQLWKIIEKQRSIIQDLQNQLSQVTLERDLLLKQTNQPNSPPSDSSEAEHYARRPLPAVDPSLENNNNSNNTINLRTSTSSPIPSINTTAAITINKNNAMNPPTSSSAFDFMFMSNESNSDISKPLNINNNNSNYSINTNNDTMVTPTTANPAIISVSPTMEDDMIKNDITTLNNMDMDEKDIMLYAKYHEALRRKDGGQSLPTSTLSSSTPITPFITHSPLPPPPQRHGPSPSPPPPHRQLSAPALFQPADRSSFLEYKISSQREIQQLQQLQHQNQQQQKQQQQSYAISKFMEEEEDCSTINATDNNNNNKPSGEYVRYEDGYFDPSLDDVLIPIPTNHSNDGSLMSPPPNANTTAASHNDTPMLKDITVKVLSSNMTTNEKGKEIFSFTVAVGKISQVHAQGMDELWRAEKLFSDFIALDYKIKTKNPNIDSLLFRLPDKSLFISRAPSKVDERKSMVELYLQNILTLRLENISDLCEFLCSNVLQERNGPPKKKYGYLTKRGKNFGGWKMRFFVLDGPVLNYFENKGGQYLGSINLVHAQIGSQITQSGSEDAYRHAFLILEPKKSAPNGIHRHVLCADSDMERDQWVEAMKQYVDHDNLGQKPSSSNQQQPIDYRQQLNKYLQRSRSDASSLKKKRKDSNQQRHARQRSSLDENVMREISEHQHQNDNTAMEEKNGGKSRNFWGRKKSAGTTTNDSNTATLPNLQGLSPEQATALMNSNGLVGLLDTTPTPIGERGPNQVFGIPLEEAVNVRRISEKYELPAIVYRCIEYLEAKDAAQEEGIYRLSGSATKIRKLKEKFNEEGDVLLLELDEYNYEVHAIAGLLKMWFRELPGSVLTEELLDDFLRVADINDRQERTNELGRLVSTLPLANYTLLRTLSAHLIRVVENSGVNKMTLRNIGIVFSATLGIPAVLFNLFLSEFDYVFWTKHDDANNVLIPNFSPSQENNNNNSIPNTTSPPSSTSAVEYNAYTLNTMIPTNNNYSHLSLNSSRTSHLSRPRSNRNSIHYMDGAPQSIVKLEKRTQSHVSIIDEDEDEDNTLGLEKDELLALKQQQQIQPQHQQPQSVPQRQPRERQLSYNMLDNTVQDHEYTALVIEPTIRL